MKILTLLITLPLALTCTQKSKLLPPKVFSAANTTTVVKDTIQPVTNTLVPDELPLAYSDFYLVVVDKSTDYKHLNNEMKNISKDFDLEMDTLGRYYHATTQEIILPEDDEDEIYAGSYYPRRFESKSLSIEYSSYYTEEDSIQEPKIFPTEMILVAGMFYEQKSADSLVHILKSKYAKARVQKAKVYVGCMH